MDLDGIRSGVPVVGEGRGGVHVDRRPFRFDDFDGAIGESADHGCFLFPGLSGRERGANGATDQRVGSGQRDGGIQISTLLPAVQSPPQEAYSLIGFCDGSVLVAMGNGQAANTIGNANFNFTTTFGVAESTVISDLQAGDQNAIIAVLDTAYAANLLPAVQTGASPGTLVTFSTPANVGTISVVENAAPEPATLCVMAPVMAMLVGRRRRSCA